MKTILASFVVATQGQWYGFNPNPGQQRSFGFNAYYSRFTPRGGYQYGNVSPYPTSAFPGRATPPASTYRASDGSTEPTRDHNSDEWKIWAFSTAAPSFIAESATVVDADQTVLREGSNSWTCMPANPRGMADSARGWQDPHEAMPLCFEADGMDWIMGYMGGVKPDMKKDTYVWMLHGDKGEDNTKAGVLYEEDAAEGQWIESGPHLMLMPKDPSTLDAYPTDFTTGNPYVMFKGSDYAHLMIPVEDYYKYHSE